MAGRRKGEPRRTPRTQSRAGVSLKRRVYGSEVHGLPSSYLRSRLTFDESPLRESCTVGSVGEVSGNWHLYPTPTSPPIRAQSSARMTAKRR